MTIDDPLDLIAVAVTKGPHIVRHLALGLSGRRPREPLTDNARDRAVWERDICADIAVGKIARGLAPTAHRRSAIAFATPKRPAGHGWPSSA